MTPDAPGVGGPPPPDEEDLGEPVAELRDLSLAVQDRFGRRVRGGIESRVLAGEFIGLAWTAPAVMLFEFLGGLFDLLAGKRRT